MWIGPPFVSSALRAAMSIFLIPMRLATFAAAACANLAASGPCGPKLLVSPRATFSPARCQPMVPFFSAITLLGRPALISDCAPMIERVRPAQFTTTRVSGLGTRSLTR